MSIMSRSCVLFYLTLVAVEWSGSGGEKLPRPITVERTASGMWNAAGLARREDCVG